MSNSKNATTEAIKATVKQLQRKIDFQNLLHQLMTGDPVLISSPDTPPWFEKGKVFQIEESTYLYHLQVLPPRWLDGDVFAFGEGTGPFQLFWKRARLFFGRQLSNEETFEFCRLSGTVLVE